MTTRILTSIALAGLLAACAGDRSEEVARQNAADHQACLDLGFTEGTEDYGNCRLKLREIRAMERNSRSSGNVGVGIGIGIGL